jgi:hypothetical protein
MTLLGDGAAVLRRGTPDRRERVVLIPSPIIGITPNGVKPPGNSIFMAA